MDRKNVKIGMKVVPHDKTAGNISFEKTAWNMEYRESQGYLIVTDQWHTDVWGLAPTTDMSHRHRQEYSSADFEPYIETERG